MPLSYSGTSSLTYFVWGSITVQLPSLFYLIGFSCFYHVFLKKWANPASFSFIFGLFKQTLLQFLQQIKCEKCPSSIQCRDSNSQPTDYQSPPLTTRPGLPFYHVVIITNLLVGSTPNQSNRMSAVL